MTVGFGICVAAIKDSISAGLKVALPKESSGRLSVGAMLEKSSDGASIAVKKGVGAKGASDVSFCWQSQVGNINKKKNQQTLDGNMVRSIFLCCVPRIFIL